LHTNWVKIFHAGHLPYVKDVFSYEKQSLISFQKQVYKSYQASTWNVLSPILGSKYLKVAWCLWNATSIALWNFKAGQSTITWKIITVSH